MSPPLDSTFHLAYSQRMKPTLVIPVLPSNLDEPFSSSPPSNGPKTSRGSKAARDILQSIEDSLQNSLLQIVAASGSRKHRRTDSSPRLAHEFPTPPLSPDSKNTITNLNKFEGSTDFSEYLFRDYLPSTSSFSTHYQEKKAGNLGGFTEDILSNERTLKLSNFSLGETVMVRCNKSKWHYAEIVKFGEDSVRVWVAAAKSTVDVPIQLLKSHLAKVSTVAPITPRVPSPKQLASPSLATIQTVQSPQNLNLGDAGVSMEAKPPPFVKSVVHAVRPAHLSHRQLFQQMPSAGNCNACQLPIVKGSVSVLWSCKIKAHFSCMEPQFKLGVTSCISCVDQSCPSECAPRYGKETDIPIFHCACGQYCSLKDMEEDPVLNSLCCPSCHYNPWSMTPTIPGTHSQSTNSSASGSPQSRSPQHSSILEPFFDSDLFSRGCSSSSPSPTRTYISSPSKESLPESKGHVVRRNSLDSAPSSHVSRSGVSGTSRVRSASSVNRKSQRGLLRSSSASVETFSKALQWCQVAGNEEASFNRPPTTQKSDELVASEKSKLSLQGQETSSSAPVARHRRRSTLSSVSEFMDAYSRQPSEAFVATTTPKFKVAAPSGVIPSSPLLKSSNSNKGSSTGRKFPPGIPPRSTTMLEKPPPSSPAAKGIPTVSSGRTGGSLRRTVSLDAPGFQKTQMPVLKGLKKNIKPHMDVAAPRSGEIVTWDVANCKSPKKADENSWGGGVQWISVVKNGKDVRPMDEEFEKMAAFKEGSLGKEKGNCGKGQGKEKWVSPLKKT